MGLGKSTAGGLALLFQLFLDFLELVAALPRPVLSRIGASQDEETEYACRDVHGGVGLAG